MAQSGGQTPGGSGEGVDRLLGAPVVLQGDPLVEQGDGALGAEGVLVLVGDFNTLAPGELLALIARSESVSVPLILGGLPAAP